MWKFVEFHTTKPNYQIEIIKSTLPIFSVKKNHHETIQQSSQVLGLLTSSKYSNYNTKHQNGWPSSHLPHGPHSSPRAAQQPQAPQVGWGSGFRGCIAQQQLGHSMGSLEGGLLDHFLQACELEKISKSRWKQQQQQQQHLPYSPTTFHRAFHQLFAPVDEFRFPQTCWQLHAQQLPYITRLDRDTLRLRRRKPPTEEDMGFLVFFP